MKLPFPGRGTRSSAGCACTKSHNARTRKKISKVSGTGLERWDAQVSKESTPIARTQRGPDVLQGAYLDM